MNAREAAHHFGELFPEVYLRFHRRTWKAEPHLTPQMWGVLQHLAMTGPLTVTEAAKHMERAQSVMSEIIDGLVRKNLLERMRDARDKRRTLVWLTDHAREVITRQQSVLDLTRLEAALEAFAPADRERLIQGVRALVRDTEGPNVTHVHKEKRS